MANRVARGRHPPLSTSNPSSTEAGAGVNLFLAISLWPAGAWIRRPLSGVCMHLSDRFHETYFGSEKYIQSSDEPSLPPLPGQSRSRIRRLLPLRVVSVLFLTGEIQPMAISYDSEVDALSDLLNCYVVFCLPFNEL